MLHTETLSGIPVEAQVSLIAQFGGIAIAVITALGLIVVALLNRTRQHARSAAANSAVVKDEVKNDHTENFRDESDDRHAALLDAIDGLKTVQVRQGRQIDGLGKSVGGIRDELRGMREDDRQVRAELDAERERIRALENTQPHRGAGRHKT